MNRKSSSASLAIFMIMLGAVTLRATTLKIRDGSNKPVAGAMVRVWMPPTGPSDLGSRLVPFCEAETGEDGVSQCSPPRLNGALVVVDAKDFAPFVKSLGGETLDRVIVSRGLTLKGRVVTPQSSAPGKFRQGQLRATFVLELPERNQKLRFDRVGNVAENGEVTAHGLPDSPVSVRIDVPGFLPWSATKSPGHDFEARLKPGIVISGRVLGETRRPVKEARVEEVSDTIASFCKTDEDGHFELAVRALPVSLASFAEGYRKAETRVTKREKTAKIVITLEPGAGVTGEIVLSAHESLKQVTMWTETATSGSGTQSESMSVPLENGRFRVDLQAPGIYSIRVDAPGYEPYSLTGLPVQPRTYSNLGRVLLQRGAGAAGTVIDAGTGKPVSGAAVELRPVGSALLRDLRRRRMLRTKTDDDGAFTLSGASEGSYVVRIGTAGSPAWSRSLSIGTSELVQLGKIELGGGAEVSGRVFDRQRNPQPGLTLRFLDAAGEGTASFGEVTTATEGRFAGVRLPAGAYTVRVYSDRRLMLSQPFDVREHDRDATLDLELPVVHLSGVVRRSGRPASGGTLSLVEQSDPAERQGKIIIHGGGGASGTVAMGIPSSLMMLAVSASGEFSAERVPPGRFIAIYTNDAGTWTRQLSVPDVGEYRTVIELAGANLMGSVASNDGQPIGRAEIGLATATGRQVAAVKSDDSGRFEFADLQPENYAVIARASGYRAKSLAGFTIAEGSAPAPLRIVLSAGTSGTLAVRLTRSGGAPADFVPVMLFDGAGSMIRSLPTDASGSQDFQDLPPGRYTVVWADSFFGAGASESIQVDGPAPVTFARELTPGARLYLDCRSPEYSGKPVEFLQVFSTSGAEIASYLSGVSVGLRLPFGGRLALGTLSPGSYRLRMGVAGRIVDRPLDARTGDVIVAVP